jgi:hypothetical protein
MPTKTKMSKIQTLLRDHLTRRDGAIRRDGPAMLRLVEKTGYSTEALRSYAYGRREPTAGERRKTLMEAVRRG